MNDPLQLKLLNGEDQNQAPGLVWACRGLPGKAAEPVSARELGAAVAARIGWVWIHVDLVDQRTRGWLGDTCALPAASRAILEGHDFGFSLGHEEGVVHGVAAELHGELERRSNTVGRLYFAVTETLLVTGRRHTLASVQNVHEALVAGTLRPATAFELFEAIMGAFAQNIGLRLAEAAQHLDEVEDRLMAGTFRDDRQDLRKVRRLAVSLHRPVSSLVALFRDQRRSDWTLPGSAYEVLDRLAAQMGQLDHEVATINDRARLLQEELSAELADESNRSLRALAVISALLLPGTLVAGILGMNTSDTPLTETPGGFIVAILAGVAATGLFYWLLKRAGVRLRL